MNDYETLSEAVDAAQKNGFTHTFKIDDRELRCLETGKRYPPSSMTIVNHHRFEGPSSAGDASVLYFVQCDDGTNGTIVDAYGADADPALSEFLKAMPLEEGYDDRRSRAD